MDTTRDRTGDGTGDTTRSTLWDIARFKALLLKIHQ